MTCDCNVWSLGTELACAAMISKVCKAARLLELLFIWHENIWETQRKLRSRCRATAVMTRLWTQVCNLQINPVTNPNADYSHSIYVTM
jgi:hypothetical protein